MADPDTITSQMTDAECAATYRQIAAILSQWELDRQPDNVSLLGHLMILAATMANDVDADHIQSIIGNITVKGEPIGDWRVTIEKVIDGVAVGDMNQDEKEV